MMRTILTTLGFLAVVNLVAILACIGWLQQSGRLDRDRIERVRTIFELPVAEEAALAEAAAEEEARAVAASEEETSRWSSIALTSLAPVDAAERIRDLGDEIATGLNRDADAIVARIDAHYRDRAAQLQLRERTLAAREARFEEIQGRSADTEFAQTVADLEEMKLDTAFGILDTWIQESKEAREAAAGVGDPEAARRHSDLARDRWELVVDLLASVDSGRRSDILGELVDLGKADVAADLQLALRDRTATAVTGTESDDAQPASSQALRPGNRPERVPGGVNSPVDA